MNLMDVNKEFNTEDACLEQLERVRWPDGVRCPTCGAKEISRITRKPTAKNKRTRSFQCLEKTCKAQFSATHGTMFYRSHIPLPVWFAAIAFVMDAKKGVSALQIQRHLGIGSYETAWYMVHRIRKSMVDSCPAPLSGVIEMDETYVGARQVGHQHKPGHPECKKQIVIGLRQRGGEARFFHAEDAKSDTLAQYIRENVSEDVDMIVTDEFNAYPTAMKSLGLTHCHRTIKHKAKVYATGDIHTNTIESAFSLLKRGIVGSFHRISPKHLHRYLTEFEYRFNARQDADKFGTTLKAMLDAPTMPYKQLISSVSSEI